jgi:hypothetical protein
VQHRLWSRHALALVDVDAQPAQQLAQETRIGQPWHVGESQRLVGKQARGHQLDGGVFRAADSDFAFQPRPTGDRDTVHDAPFRARGLTPRERLVQARFYTTSNPAQAPR